MGRKVVDLSGEKFGKLEVLKLAYIKNKRTCYWLCKCECGNTKVINGDSLKKGDIKACGCLRGKGSKYSIQDKKIYKKWSHMLSRCNNPKDISYKNYGGRGIKVCKEWFDYENFAKWSIENGYSENLELDRINTNGDYSPDNCRYITRLENSRNKRKTLKFCYKGEELTLKQLADKYEINYKILWQRIRRSKMTIEKAIETQDV